MLLKIFNSYNNYLKNCIKILYDWFILNSYAKWIKKENISEKFKHIEIATKGHEEWRISKHAKISDNLITCKGRDRSQTLVKCQQLLEARSYASKARFHSLNFLPYKPKLLQDGVLLRDLHERTRAQPPDPCCGDTPLFSLAFAAESA